MSEPPSGHLSTEGYEPVHAVLDHDPVPGAAVAYVPQRHHTLPR